MTTATKHTTGPWHAIKGDTFHDNRPWGVSRYLSREACEEIDGDEAEWPSRTEVLAEVTNGPTAEADAHLMAAAPDLLASCEAIEAEFQRFHIGAIPGNRIRMELTEKQIADLQLAIMYARGAQRIPS